MLKGTIQHAPPGVSGADINQPLTGETAMDLKEAGFDFAIRYVPRHPTQNGGNFTEKEGEAILLSGVAIMLVQHVAEPGWMPSADLGKQYGAYAAQYAKGIGGMPEGVCLWLDLEEVAKNTTADEVIAYCNAWYDEVYSAAYVPGLYVGYGSGLSDDQLYHNLKFSHFWRAYNCDQVPSERGYQLIQHTQRVVNGLTIDPDTTQTDEKGDSVIWLSPT